MNRPPMHDKFRKKHQAPKADARRRQQIALEAARRMLPVIAPQEGSGELRDASTAEYYAAKRKAAAVLGHRVRPGDLPSDSEVREQVIALARPRPGIPEPVDDHPEPEEGEASLGTMADHLDRFAIYKLRLEPLEAVKQN